MLELIIKKDQSEDCLSFTKREVITMTGLSDRAVAANLERLINAGFLEKYHVNIPGTSAKNAFYRLKNEEVEKFVKNCLNI